VVGLDALGSCVGEPEIDGDGTVRQQTSNGILTWSPGSDQPTFETGGGVPTASEDDTRGMVEGHVPTVAAQSPSSTSTPSSTSVPRPITRALRTFDPKLVSRDGLTLLSARIADRVNGSEDMLGEIRNDSSVRQWWRVTVEMQPAYPDRWDSSSGAYAVVPIQPNEVLPFLIQLRFGFPYPQIPETITGFVVSVAGRPYVAAPSSVPAVATRMANQPAMPARLTTKLSTFIPPVPPFPITVPYLSDAWSRTQESTDLPADSPYPKLSVRGVVINNTGVLIKASALFWYLDSTGHVLDVEECCAATSKGALPGQRAEQLGIYIEPGESAAVSAVGTYSSRAVTAKWVAWGECALSTCG
jgi:hypothetical protein